MSDVTVQLHHSVSPISHTMEIFPRHDSQTYLDLKNQICSYWYGHTKTWKHKKLSFSLNCMNCAILISLSWRSTVNNPHLHGLQFKLKSEEHNEARGMIQAQMFSLLHVEKDWRWWIGVMQNLRAFLEEGWWTLTP